MNANANDTELLPDDHRLTAYALGELDPAEHAVIEAALRRQPELRVTVEEIREATAQLEAALATEVMPEVSERTAPEFARAAIVPGRDPRTLDGGRVGGVLQFPRAYWMIGGLAAACFAVLVALRPPPAARPAVAYAPGESVLERLDFVEDSLASLDVGPAAGDRAMEFTQTIVAAAPVEPAVPAPAIDLAPRISDTPPPRPRLTFEGPPSFRLPHTPQVAWGNVVIPAGNIGSLAQTPSRLPVPGEIVLLPTFTVRASRLTPAGGHSSARAILEPRDLRPPAPAGARFGRGRELTAQAADNDFLPAARTPVSAFSVHVDAASYAHVRRSVGSGVRPPREAVRIEELLNHFPFRYAPPPARGDAPFAAALEVAEAPWAPGHRLVRIGLKGREVATAARPAANLVFLIDVSGSMNQPDKLPLVQHAMRLLVGRLRPDDRVAIVTYAGATGIALPSTPVARAPEILRALDDLATGGPTNGATGLRLAYAIARAHFAVDGLNRVIFCTDGDFNVGVTDEAALLRLVEDEAAGGVSLAALGFGMGLHRAALLEQLAAHGEGHHAYIATRREAEKELADQVSGTLVTIARDVKVQVEFNPAKVASHRLIGYENRLLRKEDFADDKVDAGEIGAGHTVTALYEIVPAPGAEKARGELLKVSVRYKKPGGGLLSRKLDFALADARRPFAQASADFRFAAAVAHYGMILRDSPHRGRATIEDTAAWAAAAIADGTDARGYRAEFLELVRKTRPLVE
ncbi:MAG: von Willebrand factor type A domain-containing protein [Opitutaceae bacterium]|nr:von Willebrand factor type A domain-containing protein [Opitutaceae bacterium]